MKSRRSLATTCVSLNNIPCIVRPTLVDSNPIKLNYYLFMISRDKCNISCNVVDDISTKMCVPNKTKDANIKIFNMITRINVAKTLVKHISFDCKCKFENTACNPNQKWNNETM